MRKKTKPKSTISTEWRRWIAENKMLSMPDLAIIENLVKNGIDQQVAAREVQEASIHPYIQAAAPLMEKMKKYEALINLYAALSIQSPTFGQIRRERNITQERFLQQYYSTNTPVVLVDLMQNWKALSLWTPQYLKT